MEKLTPVSKFLIVAILSGSTVVAARTHGHHFHALMASPSAGASANAGPTGAFPSGAPPGGSARSLDHADPNNHKKTARAPGRPVRVALSQWPGHMPLVIAAGGMRTQPGSKAAGLGLDVEIVFIEDAPSKNKALMDGSVDFVWQT